MWMLIGFWLALLASLGGGIFLFLKLKNWRLIDRILIASTPTILLLASFLLFDIFLIKFSSLEWHNKGTWSPIRLLPTFALAYHYPLYADSTNDPIIGMIYGPIMALAYAPTLIAKSPTLAVVIGSLLTAVFYFSPVLALSFRSRLKPFRYFLAAAIAFALFVLFTVSSSVLRYVAFSIHADSPALGLSAAACVALCYRKRQDDLVLFSLSAVFAVLAVWTKQVTVPVVVALPLYLLLTDGFRCCKRYILCLLGSGLLVSALLLVFFNPQNLFFNMFVIPSHHPWRGDSHFSILLSSSWELLKYCLFPLIIIAAATVRELVWQRQKESLRVLLKKPWILFALLGILSVPTSLLGRAKIGGDVNTLSYALYFFAIAATVILVEFFSQLNLTKFSSISRILKTALAIGCSAFLLVQLFNLPNQTAAWSRNLDLALANLYNYPSQTAYEYAKKHPGEAYFPWQTLSSIMAEGKMYHFEYGIFDRDLAEFPVSDRQFQAAIPPNLQLIAFYSRNDGHILKRLPEFSRQVELEELPGWTVYMRED